MRAMKQGGLSVPETFRSKVMGWLGNNEEFFGRTMNQTITSIFNDLTNEHTSMSL